MKTSTLIKLIKISERLKVLNALLIQKDITKNLKNYRNIMREHAELTPIVNLYHTYIQATQDIVTAQELLSDPDMKIFAQNEINVAKLCIKSVEDNIHQLLMPKNYHDERNIFLEIRAATGGNESALFAHDLLRMYIHFAERKNWQVEIISTSESEIGGYKEAIIRIIGSDAYSQLKFESGVHRVQRVPATETQGRIHTSTCTVAIMPEVIEIDNINININDIRIDTFRAAGAGGQHINKTDSAVRITHIPTGIVVECQNNRSQHKNKASALKVLAARIKNMQLRAQQLQEAATRKLLIGSGDRSERIRTYNFPQSRITDHRINLTLYKLDFIMNGDLNELTNALIFKYQTELLARSYDTIK